MDGRLLALGVLAGVAAASGVRGSRARLLPKSRQWVDDFDPYGWPMFVPLVRGAHVGDPKIPNVLSEEEMEAAPSLDMPWLMTYTDGLDEQADDDVWREAKRHGLEKWAEEENYYIDEDERLYGDSSLFSKTPLVGVQVSDRFRVMMLDAAYRGFCLVKLPDNMEEIGKSSPSCRWYFVDPRCPACVRERGRQSSGSRARIAPSSQPVQVWVRTVGSGTTISTDDETLWSGLRLDHEEVFTKLIEVADRIGVKRWRAGVMDVDGGTWSTDSAEAPLVVQIRETRKQIQDLEKLLQSARITKPQAYAERKAKLRDLEARLIKLRQDIFKLVKL